MLYSELEEPSIAKPSVSRRYSFENVSPSQRDASKPDLNTESSAAEMSIHVVSDLDINAASESTEKTAEDPFADSIETDSEDAFDDILNINDNMETKIQEKSERNSRSFQHFNKYSPEKDIDQNTSNHSSPAFQLTNTSSPIRASFASSPTRLSSAPSTPTQHGAPSIQVQSSTTTQQEVAYVQKIKIQLGELGVSLLPQNPEIFEQSLTITDEEIMLLQSLTKKAIQSISHSSDDKVANVLRQLYSELELVITNEDKVSAEHVRISQLVDALQSIQSTISSLCLSDRL